MAEKNWLVKTQESTETGTFGRGCARPWKGAGKR